MNVDGDMTYVSFENLNEFGGTGNRIESFKPGNDIANFLACTRKMSIIIGSNLFVHAGIEPELIERYNIEDMNKLLSLYLLKELNDPRDFKDDFITKSTSPLWTRTFGNVNMPNDICEKLMKLREIKIGIFMT